MMKTVKIESPYDLSTIKELNLIDKNELEKVIQTAKNLFENQSLWIPAYKRIEILEKAASLMSERIEELTHLALSEGGKLTKIQKPKC